MHVREVWESCLRAGATAVQAVHNAVLGRGHGEGVGGHGMGERKYARTHVTLQVCGHGEWAGGRGACGVSSFISWCAGTCQ